MRKIIILFMVATLLCVSCDFLEVPLESSVSTSNFYKTTSDFNMSLTGVYNILLSAEWSDNARYGTYFQGFLLMGRVGTDELLVGFDNGHGESAIGDYSYTPTNLYVSRPWYMMYKGIQRANVIIDRLTPMTVDDESEKNRILGESYFLRAFFYFHLVRMYGEVPIVDHETSDVSELNSAKQSIADVYGLIVSDLLNAKSMLPVMSENGRAGYYAAAAMLGKVYLQMAGEPLNDATAASLAESQLKEVIESGKYALVTDYFGLFNGKNEYGSEYIWDVEFANNGTTTYGGLVGTTEGVPSPASIYWTMVRSSQEFYETFDTEDMRRDAIARFVLVYDENNELVPEYSSSPEEDYYYFAYKFRHPLKESDRGSGWVNWANPINFPIIRYSDVLLMYAEASLRAHGSASSDALEYVNQVRRRGFGKQINTPSSSVDLSSLSYDNLLSERSYELCFEGQRWYDLVRFGKLEEGVKKLGKYTLTQTYTSQAQNFKEKHKFFPVPQDVIDASNGTITQNELWK